MTTELTEAALIEQLKALPPGRHLVAVAGAPASGKSGLARRIVAAINQETPGRAAVLPMDGYHFDDRVLKARGHRRRKGAPHTFDVDGLRHMLARLRKNEEAEIAIPLFDRKIETARAGAALIPQGADLVVVEGNYLLLDQPPWDTLVPFFDLTVLLEVPEAELHRRLTLRWRRYKLPPDQIMAKLEENDLPNGRLVREASRAPDFLLRNT